MADAYCTYDDCGYPCPDQAYLCEKHTKALREELLKVEKIADEFDAVLARQTNVRGLDRGAGSSEQPLPYDDRVTQARWLLTATVTTWAREVAEERGIDLLAVLPLPLGPSCVGGLHCVVHGSCRAIRGLGAPTEEALAAALLLDNVSWLRFQRYADHAADELISTIRASEYLVDLRGERLYLGRCGAASGDRAQCPCDCHVAGLGAACSIDGGCGLEFHVAATGARCGRDLYAQPGRSTATCPACKTPYDVAERRAHVLAIAENHRAPAGEISALCRHMLGADVSTAMIRGYARRGRISAHGTMTDQRGKEVPAYRVGDVVDVVRATRKSPALQRDARKAAKEVQADEAKDRELVGVG